MAYICPGTPASCGSADPYTYTYKPPAGTSEVVVSPGFSVQNRSGDVVGLPAGVYTVGVYEAGSLADTVSIDIFSNQERDLSIWHQAVARESSTDPCPADWAPSWAHWPNSGSGGFVCNHRVYVYYPELPVLTPNSVASGQVWRQSIGRASAESECPEGYQPGWAQWPNSGAGGYTCDRAVQ